MSVELRDAPGDVAVGECALGIVGVRVGAGGVAAVVLGDDEASVLATALLTGPGLPEAGSVGGAAGRRGQPHPTGPLSQALTAARSLAAGDPCPPVALDIRGTPFQQRVWQEIGRIEPGRTRTYGELAAALGVPGAARAVGGACGANPVALFIPCHRVIAADGSVGGYAWGVARKEALLAAEGARSGVPTG